MASISLSLCCWLIAGLIARPSRVEVSIQIRLLLKNNEDSDNSIIGDIKEHGVQLKALDISILFAIALDS